MFCYLIDCCAISPLTEVPWGRAEKAGSGVDKIVSGWKYLGWPLPTVAEETRPDYVVLTLQLGTEPHKKTRQESPISRNYGGSKSWSSALSQSRYPTLCSIRD